MEIEKIYQANKSKLLCYEQAHSEQTDNKFAINGKPYQIIIALFCEVFHGVASSVNGRKSLRHGLASCRSIASSNWSRMKVVVAVLVASSSVVVVVVTIVT